MATAKRTPAGKPAKAPAKKKPGTRRGMPPVNKFWELRSKHGREKIFSEPLTLWEESCKYFEYVETTPLWEQDYVGGFAKKVERRKARPMTIQGLCLYLGVCKTYIYDFEDAIKKRKEEGTEQPTDEDFSETISRIRGVIWTQKFDNAAAGLFNASLISKEIGLVDKTEAKIESKNVNENYNTGSVDVVVKRSNVPLSDSPN